MTQSLFAFPAPSGGELKREGMELISANNPSLIQRLRAEAIRIANMRGWCHVDDLRRFAFNEGLTVPSPLWGAVFSGRGWKKVGEKASDWPQNHGHRSPCWAREES